MPLPCRTCAGQMAFLKDRFGAPKAVMDVMGWGRFALCCFGFQPLVVLAVVSTQWLPAAHPLRASHILLGASWLPTLVFGNDAAAVSSMRLSIEELGKGLSANSAGHATYLLFRLARLEDQRRNRVANGLGNVSLKYGRQAGLLEAEMALLAAAAAALLLTPPLKC